MSVIPLTICFSLLLAGLFIVLFVHEQRRRRFASPERDSLLPLADETPRIASEVRGPHEPNLRGLPAIGRATAGAQVSPATCGCRRGARVPCADCLRRRDEQDPAYF